VRRLGDPVLAVAVEAIEAADRYLLLNNLSWHDVADRIARPPVPGGFGDVRYSTGLDVASLYKPQH
jgi:hypothetical protein